ncbi:cellulose synthase-like protein G1 isoform X2 [Humulus lupulus]|uniref:cellulose synthase-like protein G1 isoform X2 n=1 Tax=Humulus lupulus TaxID=3486 RepID=UPI002B417EB1|nr:cellulose synthase-like protein G1 isoform X2 [Humulus lupulus]
MEALRRRLSTTGAPPLHKAELSRLTIPNRIFAAVYASAVVTLLYHHAVTLASLLFHYSTSTKISSLFISTAFLISDVVLAVVWTTTQSFRMRPIHREEFPEKINTLLNDKECEEEFPAIDVFVCTADPYKEPPMNVVNTVLSVMAYDYPAGKVSVYVSDDGGSALTLFAFVEAAKFAAHWLPFCRENDVVDRCPEAYFASANLSSSSDIERIKIMYESMKVRVENVIEMGKVGDENIIGEEEHQAFNKWTGEFTRQDHPTVIQVILHKSKNKDITGHVMPNLIYVAREKRRTSIHNFKAGALNALVGVRYGSLVEDFFTSYHLQCEGWKGIFCNPKRAAFYGDSPITLIDVLTQHKRWAIGLLEVLFSKYCPIIFGTRFMGLIMGFAYSHNSLWPIWSIPGVIYAFLPQLALINGVSVFPKVSEPLFILYIFLFMGAYGQDLLDFIIDEGTFQRWWNDQRMWMIKTLTCFLFGSIEYSLKSLGISSHNFNVTSKVIDFEQSKRYEQGVFEFGLHSPMFVTLTMAAMTNLVALVWGLKLTFLGDKSAFDELFMQVIIAAFVVVNCKPIYGAILLRSSSKGGIPTKTTLLSMLLASSFFLLAFFSFTI